MRYGRIRYERGPGSTQEIGGDWGGDSEVRESTDDEGLSVQIIGRSVARA